MGWPVVSTVDQSSPSGAAAVTVLRRDSGVTGVHEREWGEWLSASGGGCPQSWSTADWSGRGEWRMEREWRVEETVETGGDSGDWRDREWRETERGESCLLRP